MFERLKWRYEAWILKEFHKYWQVGCHCGFCGKWMPTEIGEKHWAWSYCDKCIEELSKDVEYPIIVDGEQ